MHSWVGIIWINNHPQPNLFGGSRQLSGLERGRDRPHPPPKGRTRFCSKICKGGKSQPPFSSHEREDLLAQSWDENPSPILSTQKTPSTSLSWGQRPFILTLGVKCSDMTLDIQGHLLRTPKTHLKEHQTSGGMTGCLGWPSTNSGWVAEFQR